MNFDFRTPPPMIRSLGAALQHIESAQLVRQVTDTQPAYLFKHALVQDSAYASLTRHERKRLHRLVGTALETLDQDALEENAALLAFHFERAEAWERALSYLSLAAEHARRAAAHREEIELLARAISIAERLDVRDTLVDLHLQRGKAFGTITRFADARQELEQALAYCAETDVARRADILVSLAIVDQWRQEFSLATQEAQQARALGEQAGRNDLVATAMSTIALIESTRGDVRASVTHFEQAFALVGDSPSGSFLQGMEMAGLAQYWLGNARASLERNGHAVALARRVGDTVTIMRGLSNLGMALWASGEYAQAIQTFGEARAFGEEHGLGAWLARQMAIEGGFHLELYDYAGAEQLSRQARALAATYKFTVAITSPGIDLLFNYARTGRVDEALYIQSQVNVERPQITGAHNWLIELRFLEASAELEAARRNWDKALSLASQAIEMSDLRGRIKYQALGLQTRARAWKHLGHPDQALNDARAAMALARPTGNPAMLVRAALAQLELQPDDMLTAEARAAARRIGQALPDDELRSRFEAFIAEWI